MGSGSIPLYYPLMMHIQGKRCVVVGGGRIGWRRARGLLDAGADVTVIAPDAVPELKTAAEGGKLAWEPRAYRPGDLAGAHLAFAAADDAEVNETVVCDALRTGIWISAVDQAERGDFIVPSIVRRGALTIAVATGGASPKLARRIAGELTHLYGEEYEIYLEVLARVRRRLKEEEADMDARRAKLEHLLDLDLLTFIRAGGSADAVENTAWAALESVSRP